MGAELEVGDPQYLGLAKQNSGGDVRVPPDAREGRRWGVEAEYGSPQLTGASVRVALAASSRGREQRKSGTADGKGPAIAGAGL